MIEQTIKPLEKGTIIQSIRVKQKRREEEEKEKKERYFDRENKLGCFP